MNIQTASGLSGQLISFKAINPESSMPEGWAIVRREQPPVEAAPYSIHHLYEVNGGQLIAECGIYDLTLEDALARFERLH